RAVGAEVALDRAGVHVDHRDAMIARSVSDEDFVRLAVDREAHRPAKGFGAIAVGGERGRSVSAPAPSTATAAAAPGCTAPRRDPGVRGVSGTTRRRCGHRCRGRAVLRDEFAVLRELENSRITAAGATNPNVARVVDRQAGVGLGPIVAVARAAPMGDESAAWIELEHVRRRGAALTIRGAADGQPDLRALGEAVRQVLDEDVVARIDGHARRGSEDPAIAHRLRDTWGHFRA